MDIKGSFDKYELITRVNVKIRDIIKSIDIIMKSGISYEFRTTVLGNYHTPEDFLKIGKPFEYSEIAEARKILEKFVSLVEIR